MSSRTATFKSFCPACSKWMERGDNMERHKKLNEWVHEACKSEAVGMEFVERFARLGKLSREDVRKVAKSCGITVTREGRYIDAMECRTTTAEKASEPAFSNAIALALGTVPSGPTIVLDEAEDLDADGKLKPEVLLKKEDLAKLVEYVPVANFDFMVDAAKTGDNIFLVGPSGGGKTETGRQIGKSIEAEEIIRQNFDGETTTDNMVGYSTIGVDEKSGRSVTKWQDGELARACRLAASGKKIIYVADEVPAGRPDVLFKFHRVLELDKRTRVRTIEIDGELLTIPGGMLTIVGTGNSFRMDESGSYAGSNSMNQAFCNRWTGGVYFVDYPTAPNEIAILVGNGIARKIAEPLVAMARAIREEGDRQNNRVVCSTRQLLAIGEKAMRWGCRKAVELVYINTLLTDERKMVDPLITTQAWPR